jgi:mannose-6-phosphate isomerase
VNQPLYEKFYLPQSTAKVDVIDKIRNVLAELNLSVSIEDFDKPWGGEFYLAENATKRFTDIFFANVPPEKIYQHGTKISPKILFVCPGGQLSWQRHERRAEHWIALSDVLVAYSPETVVPKEFTALQTGKELVLEQGMCHRLVGNDHNWGIVAEIWQHTDERQLSDKEDIERLHDFYGRSS